MSIESGDNAGRYTEEEALEEAQKMQEALHGMPATNEQSLYSEGFYAEAEKIAEGKAEIGAAINFEKREDVARFFEVQSSLEDNYKDKLKDNNGITIEDPVTNGRKVWPSAVNIGDVRIDNWDWILDRVRKNSRTDQNIDPERIADRLAALARKHADKEDLSKDINKVHGLPSEILQALIDYRDWSQSSTGKCIDAAVASGLVTEEKASTIRKAKAEGKIILSNHELFDFEEDNEGNDALYWVIAEPEKDKSNSEVS